MTTLSNCNTSEEIDARVTELTCTIAQLVPKSAKVGDLLQIAMELLVAFNEQRDCMKKLKRFI